MIVCLFSEREAVSGQHMVSIYHQDSSIFSQAATDLYKTCEYCGEICPTVTMYQKHLAHKHGDQLPYSCDICHKGFFTISGQKRHLKAEHQERKFVCGTCQFRFKRKDHLHGHLKNKHGLLPCWYCSEVFSSQEALSSHHCQTWLLYCQVFHVWFSYWKK